MKELKEVVTTKITEMTESGTVDKLIQESLEKVVKSVIEDVITGYGDFKKILKSKIEESLQIGAREVQLPTYNLFVAQVLNEQYTKLVHGDAIEHLNKVISSIIVPVQKTSKISELVEQIEEICKDQVREFGGDVIEIESSMSDDEKALYVNFKHPEYSHHDVRVTFYNFRINDSNTWHIGYINEGGDNVMTGRVQNKAASHFSSLSNLLFKYYAMQTEFELDEEFCDICLND